MKAKLASVCTLLAILLIVPMISIALAAPNGGGPPVRNFSAIITPTTATANVATTYTFIITNSADSNQELGCSKIVIPADFSVDSTSITVTSYPTGKQWAASLVSNEIRLNPTGGSEGQKKLAASQAVTITFSATAPVGTYILNTFAGQDTTHTTSTNYNFAITTQQPTVTVISQAQPLEGKWRTYLEGDICNCNNDCKVSYNSNYEDKPLENKVGYEFEVEIECEGLADQTVTIFINDDEIGNIALDEDGKGEHTFYISYQLYDNDVITVEHDGETALTSDAWFQLW